MKKTICIVLACLLLACMAGCGGFKTSKQVTFAGASEQDGAQLAVLFGVDAAEIPAAEQEAILEDRYAILLQSGAPVAEDAPVVVTAEAKKEESKTDPDALKVLPVTGLPEVQVSIACAEALEPGTMDLNFYSFMLNVIGQALAEDMGYVGLVEKPLPMCGACVKPAGALTMAVEPGLEGYANALVESYCTYNLQADITLVTVEDAMAQLKAGECSIAFGYGQLTSDAAWQVTPMAQLQFKAIVHAENPVESIAAADVLRLLNGETLRWDALNA